MGSLLSSRSHPTFLFTTWKFIWCLRHKPLVKEMSPNLRSLAFLPAFSNGLGRKLREQDIVLLPINTLHLRALLLEQELPCVLSRKICQDAPWISTPAGGAAPGTVSCRLRWPREVSALGLSFMDCALPLVTNLYVPGILQSSPSCLPFE